MQSEPKKVVPFFARFLEEQEYPEVSTDLRAGKPTPPPVPTKPTLDLEHTLKYPSDGDEI